jgi:predicted enzyme related to lactoylglutathione lyase
MSEELYWNPMVPELTVSSVEHSLKFYLAAGFKIRFHRTDPSFAYLELGQAQIMLEQEHGEGWNVRPLDRPLGRGINFQIDVPDVQWVFDSLSTLGAPVFREIKETWYRVDTKKEEGQREFLVQDPDGYLLRFAQYLGSRPTV